MSSYLSDEDFAGTWEAQVSRKQFEELREFARGWYEDGLLPKHKKSQLTFTKINQQLFYEATLEANASLYMTGGAKSGADVRMAMEGGFGNHLFVEKMRHNTLRKAFADRDAREKVDRSGIASEDMGDVMGGTAYEFDPTQLSADAGDVDDF